MCMFTVSSEHFKDVAEHRAFMSEFESVHERGLSVIKQRIDASELGLNNGVNQAMTGAEQKDEVLDEEHRSVCDVTATHSRHALTRS